MQKYKSIPEGLAVIGDIWGDYLLVPALIASSLFLGGYLFAY